MGEWIAISRTQHAKKKYRPRAGYEFAAKQQVVPVMLAELARLLPHYALGFMQAEDATYHLVALAGLGGERNLYITHDHLWLCNYVPAALRAFPFAMHNDSAGNKIFCLLDSHLSDDEEHPSLFNAEGELDKLAAEHLNFVSQCENNRQITATACAALAKVGLIKPWAISINRPEAQEPLQVNGVHRIDEEAMAKLDAVAFADLRKSGALAIAYAQIFATVQLEQLTLRLEYFAKEKLEKADLAGLGSLLNTDSGGSLNFDFLNEQ